MFVPLLDPHIAIRHLNEEIAKLETKILYSWYEDDNIWYNLRIQAMKDRIENYSKLTF